MKIIICDDEPAFVELISEYCMRFKEEEEIPMRILRFFSGRDVLEYCETDRDIDLFILDIKMEDIDGLCLTKKLRGMGMRSKIVFLTSALAFAPKGYEMGVSRYWMKPLEYGRFCSEMKALCGDIERENGKYLLENVEGALEKVYFDEIVYIETDGRKTRVHRSGSSYGSTVKMVEYEQRLDGRFYRCHASYIVNMDYIKQVKGTELKLTNGEVIYISKGKKSAFSRELSDYLLG